jgi:hypothetical protein
MGDKVISAKVDEDSRLYQEFEDFAADYQTQSEAVRAAMRRGLKGTDTDGPASSGGGGGLLGTVASKLTMNTATVCLLATVFSWLAAASLLGSGSVLVSVVFWSVGFAALVVGALLAAAAALASVAINQPLRALLPGGTASPDA